MIEAYVVAKSQEHWALSSAQDMLRESCRQPNLTSLSADVCIATSEDTQLEVCCWRKEQIAAFSQSVFTGDDAVCSHRQTSALESVVITASLASMASLLRRIILCWIITFAFIAFIGQIDDKYGLNINDFLHKEFRHFNALPFSQINYKS